MGSEASRALASQYMESVPTAQKQYDWEHKPIINGGESGPSFCKVKKDKEMKVHVNSGELRLYKTVCESTKRLTH